MAADTEGDTAVSEFLTIAAAVACGLLAVLLVVWLYQWVQARRRWRWLVRNRPADALWIAAGAAAAKRRRP